MSLAFGILTLIILLLTLLYGHLLIINSGLRKDVESYEALYFRTINDWHDEKLARVENMLRTKKSKEPSNDT